MNTKIENNSKDFRFSKPAIYKIKVQGELNQSWSPRLGDMQIKVIKKPGLKTVSMLVGIVTDQSALSGILNSLYDLHLIVLSVKVLEENNDNNI